MRPEIVVPLCLLAAGWGLTGWFAWRAYWRKYRAGMRAAIGRRPAHRVPGRHAWDQAAAEHPPIPHRPKLPRRLPSWTHNPRDVDLAAASLIAAEPELAQRLQELWAVGTDPEGRTS
ncbi:MAG: hypothetical protein L0Y54_18990 [Sporichthyaceae bacterium]|nr:hypothetical protein [Sporichthyaceae bacterium]